MIIVIQLPNTKDMEKTIAVLLRLPEEVLRAQNKLKPTCSFPYVHNKAAEIQSTVIKILSCESLSNYKA